MPKRGFKRNAKAIAEELRRPNPLVKANAQERYDNLPDEVKAEAEIREYETDRYVAAVAVPADVQAKTGAATRAGNRTAGG